jgi:hypothetical protein
MFIGFYGKYKLEGGDTWLHMEKRAIQVAGSGGFDQLDEDGLDKACKRENQQGRKRKHSDLMGR